MPTTVRLPNQSNRRDLVGISDIVVWLQVRWGIVFRGHTRQRATDGPIVISSSRRGTKNLGRVGSGRRRASSWARSRWSSGDGSSSSAPRPSCVSSRGRASAFGIYGTAIYAPASSIETTSDSRPPRRRCATGSHALRASVVTPQGNEPTPESPMSRIARHAHEIYEARSGRVGTAMEDWLAVERQVDEERDRV